MLGNLDWKLFITSAVLSVELLSIIVIGKFLIGDSAEKSCSRVLLRYGALLYVIKNISSFSAIPILFSYKLNCILNRELKFSLISMYSIVASTED